VRERIDESAARVARLKGAHRWREPETAGRAHEVLASAARHALANRLRLATG
jgi:hypothetical protein